METRQVVQKLQIISLSILAVFINFRPFFLDFVTFPCYKKSNDTSLQQMMSAIFYFQHSLNRLFNNCVNLY